MFLGGDKFQNNPGNNRILKCHECGDTNLRYVGINRTTPNTEEEPDFKTQASYICGNGHETFGAVDDWEIWGQTDVLQTHAIDSHCTSLECETPDSIYVNFHGLIGVQARESCGGEIHEDMKSRVRSQYAICGPCCQSEKTTPPNNGPWFISCGASSYSGGCTASDDFSDLSSMACGTQIETIYTTCFGIPAVAGYIFTSRWQQTSVPSVNGVARAAGSCGSAPPNYSDYGCNMAINGQPFEAFLPGYPDDYKVSGPSFIEEISSSEGKDYSNPGWSIVFDVREKACIMLNNPCIGLSAGVKGHAKRWHSIVRRTHPTMTPTAGAEAGTDWECSTEGINTYTILEVFCGEDPGCTLEDPGCTGGNFCTNGNSVPSCTNCNNAVAKLSYSVEGGRDQRHFWPNRVPYYKETLSTGSYPVTALNQLIKGVPGSFQAEGECECTAGAIACNEISPIWPDYCKEEINYPSCLQAGLRRCKDEDARWRVDCSDPQDFFTVTLLNNGLNISLLDYRYSLYIDSVTPDLDNPAGSITILFNPIYDADASSDSLYHKWRYVESPNPICVGVARPGYIPEYGDPEYNWYSSSSPMFEPDSGAIGVRSAKLEQLFPTKQQNIEQPHCTRRVRNPQLAPSIPFYMVNTADISEQTIVLDRYYDTGGNTDYLWHNRPLKIGTSRDQSKINPSGDVGSTDLAYFPHPFTANSGSLTEPEIVAIIHSENGTGAQIAFQTVPMSYDAESEDINDADVFIDPPPELQAPYRQDTTKSQCQFKTRKVVHGYSVMYPLRDDPIWSESISNYGAYTYVSDGENTDPNLDPTADERPDLSSTPFYDYPVLIPGSGYQLGDKIEFRCWKSLKDLKQNEEGFLGIAKNKYNEAPNQEECVETLIATATVTELNNERVAPTKIGEIWATVNIEGDDYVQQATDIYMAVDMGIVDDTRYNETYGVKNVILSTTQKSNPWKLSDRFWVVFNDTDTINNQPPVEVSRMEITVTGYDENTGTITAWEITKPGEYYKIVGNNGIRWYNFDADTAFVGNCPCTFDICDDECSGCASKAYNYTRTETIDCDPDPECGEDGKKQITIDETRKLEALAQGFDPNNFFGDSVSATIEYPFGFPAFPYAGCVTNPEIVDEQSPPEPIPLWCPPSFPTVDCSPGCRYVSRYHQAVGLVWVLKDDCDDNCGCSFLEIPGSGVSSSPSSYGENESSTCSCTIQINGGPWISGPVAGRNDSFHCWPITPTWEFPGKSGNYGYSCWYGEPVHEGYRSYVSASNSGPRIVPPKRPQYEAVWQPNTSGFLANIDIYSPDSYTDDNKKAIKDAFLSIEGCNPLLLDRFSRSSKYPPRAFGKPPCRKIDNPTDPIPDISQRLEDRPLDNYCRAYGFYQQIQPSCDIIYRGQYIMRTAYKEGIDLTNGLFTDGDCNVEIVPAGFDGSNAHKFTGCTPIVSDLEISLRRGEVQFDITAGAPT